MKRFFAVLILIVADFLLYSVLFLVGGKPVLDGVDIGISVVTLALGLGALLGGMVLWGWQRKFMTGGVSAVIIGLIEIFMSLSSKMMSASDPRFPVIATLRLLILGVIVLAAGVMLIAKQVKLDKNSAAGTSAPEQGKNG